MPLRPRIPTALQALLVAVTVSVCIVVSARGAEQIFPAAELSLLQRTFQFTATAEEDSTEVIMLLMRFRLEQGKEVVMPPMLGRAKIVRGRNLVNITLLPTKDETLVQFSLNGNGEGYRLFNKFATDDAARSAQAQQFVFLAKPAWSKERQGLILTEGPEKAPERIRCVLEFYHPDPEHEESPGRIFGKISAGADNF